MLDKFRHIHFIGIGGSGISSIAYLALAHGLKVTGSDIALSPVIKELENEGATIYIGHKKENVHELAELVVYTEAIDKKIAELKLASLGVRIDHLTPEQKKYLASWEMGT